MEDCRRRKDMRAGIHARKGRKRISTDLKGSLAKCMPFLCVSSSSWLGDEKRCDLNHGINSWMQELLSSKAMACSCWGYVFLLGDESSRESVVKDIYQSLFKKTSSCHRESRGWLRTLSCLYSPHSPFMTVMDDCCCRIIRFESCHERERERESISCCSACLVSLSSSFHCRLNEGNNCSLE